MLFEIFIVLVIATTCVNSLQEEQVHVTKLKPNVSGNEMFDTIVQSIISVDTDLKRFTAFPKIDLKTNWFQVDMSLTATDDVLHGLTSLRRISEVTNFTVGDTTYFQAAVTLDNLGVTFSHHDLQLGLFWKTSGRLTLNVGTISFNATLKSHVSGQNCQLTLDHLKVYELKAMKVDLSNLNFLNRIVTWLTEYVYENINAIVESPSKDMVNYVIKDKKICEKFLEDYISDRSHHKI